MPPVTRSGSKRKREKSMNNNGTTTVFLNDLVSLPIIISDYDAVTANKRRSSGANTEGSVSRDSSVAASDTASSIRPKQKWTTGFSDFTDELWSRLTAGMKQKLREAAVEVLKRTDDPSEEAMIGSGYDDDARLLD